MSTVTKRWWRVAVVAAVAGGAIGVARYAGATEEPAVWAAAQVPATPAAATFPVPALPQLPTDPRGPLAPPALPGVETPTAPPAPKPIDISPVAPPMPLIPPPTAVKTPSPLPAPSAVIPPPKEIAQPAPPAKSAEVVKPPRPVTPDFNLQPSPGGNTFKTDVPAPPALPVTPPVTPPTSLIPPLAAPRGDAPAKVVDRPKPVEGPLFDSEKFTFPLPTALPTPTPTPTTTHPGDPIMTNVFKQSALAAVIGGALAGAPLTPANAFPAPSPQNRLDPTPAELKRSIDDANTRMAALESTMKRLTDLIDGRKDEKGFKLESDPGVVAEVKKLRDDVAALKAQITTLQSSSLRPPSTTPDPMLGKGTVSVVNQYPVEISIVVNEKSYRVAPSAKQDITVTAGDFSYQLLQNGAQPVKSTIKEKEVVTLRIK